MPPLFLYPFSNRFEQQESILFHHCRNMKFHHHSRRLLFKLNLQTKSCLSLSLAFQSQTIYEQRKPLTFSGLVSFFKASTGTFVIFFLLKIAFLIKYQRLRRRKPQQTPTANVDAVIKSVIFTILLKK